MRTAIFALCCCLTPLAAQAQSYRAVNHLYVVPLNSTDFEVIESRGKGPRGIWCAAADYADRFLHKAKGNRIYVKTARGPSMSGVGRTGVVFTIDPRNLNTSTSYSLSVRQAGLGLPVDHAIQFCRDEIIEREDVIFLRRGDS
ncbi:MAG: hypothetical protein WBB25_22925 [Sulfitobacter sp.]